jgi:predicted acyl esterase
MRAARYPLVASIALAFASAACGLTSPRAVAEPRRAEDVLVPEPLETDVAVARAIRAALHEVRVPHPDARRREAVHRSPTCRRMPSTHVSHHAAPARRTAWRRTAVDNYPGRQERPRAAPLRAERNGFIREGYIFVHQDVRGRMMSEGTFVDVRPHASTKGGTDESTDAWDTIDWLVKNVPNEQRSSVGAWGISYPGFYAAQAAVDAHPALKAVSPQAPVTDWFMGDDFHHNGVVLPRRRLRLLRHLRQAASQAHQEEHVWGFEHDIADVYDYFLAMGPLIATRTPSTRRAASSRTASRSGTRCSRTPRATSGGRPATRGRSIAERAARHAHGGRLLRLRGLLRRARDLPGLRETEPRRSENMLVMGPWRPRRLGARRRRSPRRRQRSGRRPSLHYREEIELPFFRHHLKGKGARGRRGPSVKGVEAFVFESGTNVWHVVLGVAAARRRRRRRCTSTRAASCVNRRLAAGEDADGFDAYVSDPSKPVPYRAKTGSESSTPTT